MSNFDGKHGEIANQSGVVIQTTHDIKDLVNRMRVNDETCFIYPGRVRTLEPAVVRIDINDLVFRVGTSKAPRQNLLNGAIEVSSNVNGLAVNKNRVKTLVNDNTDPNKLDEAEVLQALSETIRFIGQALGATVPNPENEEDQKLQFTTRVQGTGHIMNTGFKDLSPGDMLYWDLFTKKEIESENFKKNATRFGFDAKKVPLKTVPLSAAHNNFNTAIQRALATPEKLTKSAVDQFGHGVSDALLYAFYIAKGSPGGKFDIWKANPKNVKVVNAELQKDTTEFNKHITSLVEGFMYFQEDLKRREIGKVLSYAASGKGVDVLFGAN